MKFNLTWLRKFLDTSASIEEIADTLTSIGIEVDDVIERDSALGDFVVAQLVEVKKHPDGIDMYELWGKISLVR